MAPFVSVDCASGVVTPLDAAPLGTTIGDVTATVPASGAPSIAIATDAEPATELGIADIKEALAAAGVPVRPAERALEAQ